MRTVLSISGLLAMTLAGPACGPSDAPAADGGETASDSGPGTTDAGIDDNADAMPMPEVAELEVLLDDLRHDRDGAMLAQSRAQGWPAPVADGHLFVSTEGLSLLAGDHDEWQGAAMTAEDDFHWLVVPVADGSRYKFTDGADTWLADPWSRSYLWDEQGLMSTVTPTGSHRERHFLVGDADMQDRTVRLWIPEQTPTHILYAHDGQNLFNPNAFFGGWRLDESAPDGLMIVGIDNTNARMDEYTHTSEGQVGGLGDQYANFVQTTVRALVSQHYGEAPKVGTMGSSLGGLISLHIADRYPGEYDFAASLSGTVGWGSMGGQGTDTIIARYLAAGHRDTAIYIDSGGNGDSCADSDGDGTNDDDPTASDNYCETRQLESTLVDMGYEYDVDLWHWWEPNAPHNEQAWAARVFRPLQDFMSL